MKNKIILLASDPNSINSEIISKSWKKISPSVRKQIYLIANYNLMNKQFKILKTKIPTVKINHINEKSLSKKVTSSVKVPTIGIGASINCDGQILVTDDLLGLNSTIGNNVALGSETIVGAGSVITKSCEQKSVFITFLKCISIK